MASHRLIDNRIFDRISINKSNKGNNSEETTSEFDKNMEDFVGTWESVTEAGGVAILGTVIVKKVSNGNYTSSTSIKAEIGDKYIELLNYTNDKPVSFTGKGAYTVASAYKDFRNFWRAAPELGTPNDSIPFNGTNIEYILDDDKTTMRSLGQVFIDRKTALEQVEQYPILGTLFGITQLVGSVAFTVSDDYIKIN